MKLDRAALRSAYDAVVLEIDQARTPPTLTNSFYSQIGDSVFDACYSALEQSVAAAEGHKAPRRMYVVSAPMGTGKTTFAIAFLVALTRLAETDKHLPYGGVFLADQMTKADDVFRELNGLLPGKVAVWTSDHDVKCAKPEKVHKPAARFHVEDLRNYPVAVVTHAFYKGPRGEKARRVIRNGEPTSRTLTIIDEQPHDKDVAVYDVTFAQAASLREALQEREGAETIGLKLEALMEFMWAKEKAPHLGSIEKPNDDPEAWKASAELDWFATEGASRFVSAHGTSIPHLGPVFGFAKTMANGCAFVSRKGKQAQFVGYESTLALVPGMVLLDATSDIDGITPLCPWRKHVEIPPVRYSNLSISHVKPFTKKKLGVFLKTLRNRSDYVEWMVSTVKQHMAPGQRGLVVCKKTLFDNEHVPTWKPGDTHDYAWEIEGRYLWTTHWGTGIGANTWQDADVVFLFDEFHIPKRSTIATAQGLQGHKATTGPLGSMRTLNARSPQIDELQEGHLLRWFKQMALRGKGRRFDGHGVCGVQKLVCAVDYRRLIANFDRLFPGAVMTRVRSENTKGYDTRLDALIEMLSAPRSTTIITTKEIGDRVGVPWRRWSKEALDNPSLQAVLMTTAWKYVPVPGRAGGRFERTTGGALSFAMGG